MLDDKFVDQLSENFSCSDKKPYITKEEYEKLRAFVNGENLELMPKKMS